MCILYHAILFTLTFTLVESNIFAYQDQPSKLKVTVLFYEKNAGGETYTVLACPPDFLSLDPVSCVQGGTTFLDKVSAQRLKEELFLRAEFGSLVSSSHSDVSFAIQEYIKLRPHTRLESFENILKIKEREFKTLSNNIRTTLNENLDQEIYNTSTVVQRSNSLQKEIIDLENQRDKMSQSLNMISGAIDLLMQTIQEQPIVYLPVEEHDHELSYQSYFVSLFKTSTLQTTIEMKKNDVLQQFQFREGLTWIKLGSGYGLIDKLGNWRIPPTQDIVSFSGFSNGFGIVQRKNGKVHFVDANGETPAKLDLEFLKLSAFENGIAVVTLKGGKSGLLGINGEFLSGYGPVFDKLEFGLSKKNAYQLGNQLGYILPNLEKQSLPALNFDSIYSIKQSYGIFLGFTNITPNEPVHHMINIQNKAIIATSYAAGLASSNDKNPQKVKRITLEYVTRTYPFQILRVEGETGYFIWDPALSYFDRYTNFLKYKPPFHFSSPFELDREVLTVQNKDGSWYHKYYKSNMDVGPYHYAEPFSEGKAHIATTASKGLNHNFVNHEGELLFPNLSFSELGSFGSGLAYAKTDKQRGFINDSGSFEIVFEE